MNTRIRKIRKSLELTQQVFAQRIGLKQNSIALIESGKRNTSDQTIFAICREFNVNEEWLRTGNGEMFNPVSHSLLDSLAEKYGLSHDERVLVERFIDLKPEQRQTVIEFVRKTAASFSVRSSDSNGKPVLFTSLSIDEKVQLYRRELEREEKVEAESEA